MSTLQSLDQQRLTRSSNCARILAGAQPLPRLAVEASGLRLRDQSNRPGNGGRWRFSTTTNARYGIASVWVEVAVHQAAKPCARITLARTQSPCSPSFVPRTTDSTHGQRQSPQLAADPAAPRSRPTGWVSDITCSRWPAGPGPTCSFQTCAPARRAGRRGRHASKLAWSPATVAGVAGLTARARPDCSFPTGRPVRG
jgi:hypothetical protein